MNDPITPSTQSATPISTNDVSVSADQLRRRLNKLSGKREELLRQKQSLSVEIEKANGFLEIADAVTEALDKLSQDVFHRQLRVIETTLTKALQEVLDQPIVFKATSSLKRDAASVEFVVQRDGFDEDIIRGQGGSVANILSVGLRLFAITMLDESKHRKFLVLDEQDCWLHPDLVPRLVRIVQEAGRALGFQVLMISHHDVRHFVRFADRVYRLIPDTGDGVTLERVPTEAEHADTEMAIESADQSHH
ncbi:DNA repair protein [Crateriforma spongiae]|uniref:DNA repair protein n=1 Tax=Crateriforma spongiae TaxID=2724528 RepID=UPI001F16221A|nr:DNA repair protein [Crateriforma spongiae]